MSRFESRGACFALAAAAVACVGLVACSEDSGDSDAAVRIPTSARSAGLVPDPSLDGIDDELRRRIETARSDVDRGPEPATFGALGKLYASAGFLEAAVACFEHTARLDPTNPEWPHAIGYVSFELGDAERALRAYRRALERDPGRVPALVGAGRCLVELGRHDEAQDAYERALERDPAAASAWFGLGRVAAAGQQYDRAISAYARALQLAPDATGIHNALAMAYRSSGNERLAAEHLALGGGTLPVPRDPLTDELRSLLPDTRSMTAQGLEAYAAGRWSVAIERFRRVVAAEPENVAARLNLGAALAASGSAPAAEAEFSRVLELDHGNATALLNLGTLALQRGHEDRAIAHYRDAVASEPSFVDARLALADRLQLGGLHEDALVHFAAAADSDPAAEPARLGHALSLVRLGREHEALSALEEATRDLPRSTLLRHALARLLASARDSELRDGRRAVRLADEVLARERSLQALQTLAMAYAETGDFATAVVWQTRALRVAERDDAAGLVPRLRAQLAGYANGEPCREFWLEPRDDPPL